MAFEKVLSYQVDVFEPLIEVVIISYLTTRYNCLTLSLFNLIHTPLDTRSLLHLFNLVILDLLIHSI